MANSASAQEEQRLSQPSYGEMVVEKDVEVTVRDSTVLRADVFRPNASGETFPVLVSLTPYNKDVPFPYEEGAEELEQSGPYMNWETPNPSWWVPRGYVVVRVDTRGTGKSGGRGDFFSDQESQDFYDVIEWAAAQPWSSGKVGSAGVSYMAIAQWLMADTQPPSLKAMIPWEGAPDIYAATHHGGVLSSGFLRGWWGSTVAQQPPHPEGLEGDERFVPFAPLVAQQPLDNAFYGERSAEYDEITVPFLSAGNWGGAGLHHPGNLDAFVKAASPNKRLRMHAGSHIAPFYGEEGALDQLRFFDTWLKGIDTGLLEEPPIKLAVRFGIEYTWRFENEWPLARTRWTRFYLSPEPSGVVEGAQQSGSLRLEPPSEEAVITYAAEPLGKVYEVGFDGVTIEGFARPWQDAVTFVTKAFEEDTEVTGPINLVLWVASSTDDLDLFVTLRNIDPEGNEVLYAGPTVLPVSVTKGWLRASVRELDPACSTFHTPCYASDKVQKLTPGEVVPVQVRVAPTSTVFKAGHRLMLDVQTGDSPGAGNFAHDNAAYRVGQNSIYTGGERASYLLLPVIPDNLNQQE